MARYYKALKSISKMFHAHYKPIEKPYDVKQCYSKIMLAAITCHIALSKAVQCDKVGHILLLNQTNQIYFKLSPFIFILGELFP